MKRLYMLIFLAAAQVVLAEPEVDKQHLQQDILEKIKSPNDTALEAEAKLLIAQFLAETTLEDFDKEQDDLVPFRRDYEKERERDAQRLAEREAQRQRHKERLQEKERQREKHRNKPHYDYRNVSSSFNQAPAPAAPPAAVAVPVAAAVPVEVSRQDISTQVPILTQAPGGIVPAVTAPPAAPAATLPPAPVATIPTLPPVTRPPRPTVSPEHVYNQVDKILGSVASGNIVGIVDNSLAIRAPEPVRNFVTGILKVVFCNPINRILGRCVPNSSGAISSVQGR